MSWCIPFLETQFSYDDSAVKVNADKTFCYWCPEAHYIEHTQLYAAGPLVLSWCHPFWNCTQNI